MATTTKAPNPSTTSPGCACLPRAPIRLTVTCRKSSGRDTGRPSRHRSIGPLRRPRPAFRRSGLGAHRPSLGVRRSGRRVGSPVASRCRTGVSRMAMRYRRRCAPDRRRSRARETNRRYCCPTSTIRTTCPRRSPNCPGESVPPDVFQIKSRSGRPRSTRSAARLRRTHSPGRDRAHRNPKSPAEREHVREGLARTGVDPPRTRPPRARPRPERRIEAEPPTESTDPERGRAGFRRNRPSHEYPSGKPPVGPTRVSPRPTHSADPRPAPTRQTNRAEARDHPNPVRITERDEGRSMPRTDRKRRSRRASRSVRIRITRGPRTRRYRWTVPMRGRGRTPDSGGEPVRRRIPSTCPVRNRIADHGSPGVDPGTSRHEPSGSRSSALGSSRTGSGYSSCSWSRSCWSGSE